MSITNTASAPKSNLATPVQNMGRLPPHSIEAEQSVLGGLLLDNQCWDEVCELITGSEAFYLSEHRILFKAIQALSLKSLPFDVITIAEQLTETERQFLDLAYLASLARNTPSVAVPFKAPVVARLMTVLLAR
ncbi:DnaB helicase-like protein [Azomonas agilis]|uniref:DnaB helicase-like protein n=1 Tax=Azomonas agilis TaxID=116849 RepID=A0A562I223_9GAMM|nr:DnaB-like helicase N-terminal domain-containing protein [Azomonas agilis]TWH65050.1 DnaB helicase-like protein [Azomonas agilis]